MNQHLSFASDYMEGAHPAILRRLTETNLDKTPGYGLDPCCEAARDKIRAACAAPGAEVHFLVGGTQANATVIDALLPRYQGVISADTGHINGHEAGAIEASGHKVLALPQTDGKITAAQIEALLAAWQGDANHDHTVMPGMVYLSHPTEYGTLYSRRELADISAVCRAHGIPLYLDGARLAYALACPANDLSLPDLAALCDVFYIGGTKCGALFGEAVVIPQAGRIPHFFTLIKQHGALLAKGRILGLQFDVLFTGGLYETIGQPAIRAADRLREALPRCGFPLCFGSPTNQVFCIAENGRMARLAEEVDFGFWAQYDEQHTVIRFAPSWAVTEAEVEALCRLLERV